MKRFLVFLLVVVGPMIGFGQTLRTTINGGILSQGNKGITATKLNNVLVTVADSVSSKANKSGGVFSGTITAPSFVRAGGTSSQFLKADGSVDASAFAILGNNNVFTGTAKFNSTFNVGTIQSSSTASTNSNYSNRFNNIVFSRSDIPTTFTNAISNSWSGTNTDQTMNFEVANGASTRLTTLSLLGNGNVLVGNGATNTGHKLSVFGSDNVFGIDAGLVGNPYLDFLQGGVQKGYLQYVNTGAYFRLVDAGVVGLIQKSGQIGIGTLAPAARLHIEGTGYVSALIRSTTTTAAGLITVSNTTNSYSLGARGDYGTGQFNIVDETAGLLRVTLSQAGNLILGSTATDPGYRLNVIGTAQATQFKLSALNTAPASATATGVVGEIRIDASYIYVCTATNVWKRSALTTW
jgi:hypothetical protein